MKTLYWYKTCPHCGQGRLFVYKNLDLGQLYLHCEECEWGYYDPDKLDHEHSFLTLLEDFEAVEASEEDILNSEWSKYSFNSYIQ